MPISFPDMKSLSQRAGGRGFRQPREDETEAQYRAAFSLFMENVDPVEAIEIKTGRPADEFSQEDGMAAVRAMARRNRRDDYQAAEVGDLTSSASLYDFRTLMLGEGFAEVHRFPIDNTKDEKIFLLSPDGMVLVYSTYTYDDGSRRMLNDGDLYFCWQHKNQKECGFKSHPFPASGGNESIKMGHKWRWAQGEPNWFPTQEMENDGLKPLFMYERANPEDMYWRAHVSVRDFPVRHIRLLREGVLLNPWPSYDENYMGMLLCERDFDSWKGIPYGKRESLIDARIQKRYDALPENLKRVLNVTLTPSLVSQ